MLWEGRNGVTYTYDGKTYDLLSISPEFDEKLGTYPPPDYLDDYWGEGAPGLEGITVDYQTTSTAFWKIVAEHRPIAIMSFSRWDLNHEWMLDAWATNWARDQDVPNLAATKFWALFIGNYKDNDGNPQIGITWPKPFIGGSANDPSPFKGDGELKYKPPDRTQAALLKRDSNLPMDEMVAAINADFDPADVKAEKNDVLGPGRFVSNFLAYHVAWYRLWWNALSSTPENEKCLRSGHTHVGGQITVDDAERAVQLQLNELYKVLPETG